MLYSKGLQKISLRVLQSSKNVSVEPRAYISSSAFTSDKNKDGNIKGDVTVYKHFLKYTESVKTLFKKMTVAPVPFDLKKQNVEKYINAMDKAKKEVGLPDMKDSVLLNQHRVYREVRGDYKQYLEKMLENCKTEKARAFKIDMLGVVARIEAKFGPVTKDNPKAFTSFLALAKGLSAKHGLKNINADDLKVAAFTEELALIKEEALAKVKQITETEGMNDSQPVDLNMFKPRLV